MKEKLHFAQHEHAALAGKLTAAEAAVAAARAEQSAARATAARLRHECHAIEQEWQVVIDRRCLEDMRAQQEKLTSLQAQAADLKAQYEAGERALQGLT